jgi:hypothetical protein
METIQNFAPAFVLEACKKAGFKILSAKADEVRVCFGHEFTFLAPQCNIILHKMGSKRVPSGNWTADFDFYPDPDYVPDNVERFHFEIDEGTEEIKVRTSWMA